MSELETQCILTYLLKGVAPERGAKVALTGELLELLPNATAITILPVVDGFSVELEFANFSPFSRNGFEPYVAEHILPQAAASSCTSIGDVQLQLLQAHYR